jgi:hypothetical protein
VNIRDLNLTNIDQRDIPDGDTYYVITKPNGRCVLLDMFSAAWTTKDAAKAAAEKLGGGFSVVRQIKN